MAGRIDYVRTADGDQAARIAHLVIALIPQKDGSMRTLTAWPARDPATCTRKDFSQSGFRSTDEDGFHREVSEYAQHHEDLVVLSRQTMEPTVTRSFQTPWGTPDTATRYAEGVVRVDCPGHGGFMLSETQNDRIATAWRNPVGIDGWAWYEEDLESSIVRYSIPELFTEWERAYDERTLRSWMPDQWEAVTGAALLPGQSITRDRETWLRANADRWIVTCAERSRSEPLSIVVTSYRGGRDERGRTIGAPRRHIVTNQEYDLRRKNSGVNECLIEEHDVEVDRHPSEAPLSEAA